MIDLKEKPRRSSKRKFEENGRVQPKETLLDMSVSKLAKAQTRVNLEPSLRKTVMIVNTIRRLEQEIENNRVVKTAGESVSHCSAKTNDFPDTRPAHPLSSQGIKNTVENGAQKRLDFPLETRRESFVCENNSDTEYKDRWQNIAKSCRSDDTFIDLSLSSEMKFKNRFEESSSCISSMELTIADSEINFAEVDISLYDFDASMSWPEGGLNIPCAGDMENLVHKPSLSTFTKRCGDDLKFVKTTENSFTDDLDQIMQVLVGI